MPEWIPQQSGRSRAIQILDADVRAGLIDFVNRTDLTREWEKAIDSGTFLTPKHDPAELSITWDRFRTVLSHEAAAKFDGFIKSGEYGIRMYEDSKFPKSSGLFEIIPSGKYPFSVAGSGVPSGSITPSGDHDRLVVAYGKKDGWHVYAENATQISGSITSGRLVLKYEL